jgi:diketogulonate reductase-like aldo/keto reductase
MAEDKALWHQALAHYRAWNEAKFADRVRRAGEQSLTEKWRAYLDLMAFCWRVNPEPSKWEQRQTVKEWEAYYTRIQRFEERRRGRGTTT